MYTVSSPKLFFASVFVILTESMSDSSSVTTFIPLPPPPDAAFIITGYPIRFAAFLILFSLLFKGPFDPGTVGTPDSLIALIAVTLLPMVEIFFIDGPTNMNPLFSTCSAKLSFSARNP